MHLLTAPGILLLGFVICGCAATTPPMERTMRIELLGFPGCPNTPAMRSNLEAALVEVGGQLEFIDIDQQQLPEDDPRRGYPAPTILVNGTDLFGLPTPATASMSCRVYRDGLPGPSEIAARLRRRFGP
jgi:hypothetical protein